MSAPGPQPRSLIVDRYIAEAFAQECDDLVFLINLVGRGVRRVSARFRTGGVHSPLDPESLADASSADAATAGPTGRPPA